MSAAVFGLAPPSVVRNAVLRGDALVAAPADMDVDRPAPSKKKRRKKKKPPKQSARRGSSANVHWRAVPTRALRAHPLYRPLPFAAAVVECPPGERLARSALFRQDSWRWGALHAGVLTGAKVAAACGLLEADAAQALQLRSM